MLMSSISHNGQIEIESSESLRQGLRWVLGHFEPLAEEFFIYLLVLVHNLNFFRSE
jgi:hypothetical protein